MDRAKDPHAVTEFLNMCHLRTGFQINIAWTELIQCGYFNRFAELFGMPAWVSGSRQKIHSHVNWKTCQL